MSLSPLWSVHRWVRQNHWAQAFTLFTRALLAVGFIAPGLTKVLGDRFHNPEILTQETAIGSFFEAFFQAPEFYFFVGAAQVCAAVLLLIPRTALLGAMVYLPIIANIFAITVSLDFGNTAIITGLMLLAVVYLLCWDAHRLIALVEARRDRLSLTSSTLRGLGVALFVAGGVGATIREGIPPTGRLVGVLGCALGGVLLAVATWRTRPSRTPVAADAPSAVEHSG